MSANITIKQIRIQQEVLITLLEMIEAQDERIALKKRNLHLCDGLPLPLIERQKKSIEIASAARARLLERYERQVYILAAMLHAIGNSELPLSIFNHKQ